MHQGLSEPSCQTEASPTKARQHVFRSESGQQDLVHSCEGGGSTGRPLLLVEQPAFSRASDTEDPSLVAKSIGAADVARRFQQYVA